MPLWPRHIANPASFSLAGKLAITFGLFAVLIVSGLGSYAFVSGRTALVDATLAKLQSETLEKESALKDWARDRTRSIANLAQHLHLSVIPDSGDGKTRAAWSQVDWTDVKHDLDPWTGKDRSFQSLMIIDAENGSIRYSTDQAGIGAFKENRQYFKLGKQRAGLYGPYYSVTRQGPAITAYAPILGDDESVIAVLAGRVSVDQINEIVSLRTGRHLSDDAYLVNTASMLVTQPRLIDDDAVLHRSIRTVLVDRCLDGENTSEIGVDFTGIPVISVHRWLPKRQLCLVGSISKAEAFEPIRRLAVTISIGAAGALMLAALVTMALVRTITRPVRILQSGTAAIANNDLDVQLPEQSDDELGRLTKNFNSMARALKWRSEALQASEEQTRLLLESTGEAIYGIDLDGRCTFANPACATLLGYDSADDFLGQPMHDLAHHTHADGSVYPAAECKILKAYRHGEATFIDDEVFWRRDGSSFPVEYRAFPINRDGVIVGAVVSFVDISVRKKAEREIQALNTELEARVEARTAALRETQAELIRSERLATLGELTATVSHELRNPLGAMRTSTHILRTAINEGPPPVVRAMDRLDRSITRCDRIIDELLDFTRISNLDLQPVPLDNWLSETLTELPVPEEIAVTFEPGLNDLAVFVDPDRLRRAVINVYDNALQAMADSSVIKPARLSVSTRTDDDRIDIQFNDSGPGIPEEILPRIFEPLFSTKNFGVGLGLAVVKQILEQHQGGIDIDTNPDRGTRFTLWLPIGGPQPAELDATDDNAISQVEATG